LVVLASARCTSKILVDRVLATVASRRVAIALAISPPSACESG
jgi:hypothetical protein